MYIAFALRMILSTTQGEPTSIVSFVTQEPSSHCVHLRSYDASSGAVADVACTDFLSGEQVLDAQKESHSSDFWILSKHGKDGRLTKFRRHGQHMVVLKDARHLRASRFRTIVKLGTVATALWMNSDFDQPTESSWSRQVTLARDNRTIIFTNSYGHAGSVAGWANSFRISDGDIRTDRVLILMDEVMALVQTKNHILSMVNGWGWEEFKLSSNGRIAIKKTTRTYDNQWLNMWANLSNDRVYLARNGELTTANVASSGKVTVATKSIKVPLGHEEIWSAKGRFAGSHLLLFLDGGDMINVAISPLGDLKLMGRRSLGSASNWPI